MIKYILNTLISIVLLSFLSVTQATPITNLTQAELDVRDYTNAEDQLSASLLGINYINYKGYDWAWVSSVNIEDFGTNTLYAPELQENWQYADDALLTILRTELTVADFTAADGTTIIQATDFFNSEIDTVDVPADGLLTAARSELVTTSNPMHVLFQYYETFYVRPAQVPEPSTLMIFALGLVTLVSKKRLFN